MGYLILKIETMTNPTTSEGLANLSCLISFIAIIVWFIVCFAGLFRILN